MEAKIPKELEQNRRYKYNKDILKSWDWEYMNLELLNCYK